MKEKTHQAQIALLQKKIEMLEQKSSANASESLRKEKKKRSSKFKAEAKLVQDVNENTKFEELQVPVLEQALEELLSSSKEKNPPILYSQSEIEEFYTRLGCDSETVQRSMSMTRENKIDDFFSDEVSDELAALLDETDKSEISDDLAALLGDEDDPIDSQSSTVPPSKPAGENIRKKKKKVKKESVIEAEEILAEIFDDSDKEDQYQEFENYGELDELDSGENKGSSTICRFEPKRCDSLGEKPAIKILLANHITLKQFQAIKDKLDKESCESPEAKVVEESELHFYYESIADCWRVMKWIKRRVDNHKDIIKHVRLISAEFAPGARWKADFDSCFSVKIQVKNIDRVNIQSILVQMVRFGKVKDVLLDTTTKDYFIVRFKEQIAAENTIAHLDRAYLFGTWCRARKSQPILKEDLKKNSKFSVTKAKRHKNLKFIRPDIIITSQPTDSHPSSHHEVLPRDSWKRLLAIAIDCGPHDEASGYGNICILFGDATGITVGFSSQDVAQECLDSIQKRKIHGRSVLAEPAICYITL